MNIDLINIHTDGRSSSQDEDKLSYGVEFDTAVSNPTCTRIGNLSMHQSLPIQSKMRGCLLADDGTINAYLPSDDWTSSTRDGSLGQVMVQLPKYYRKSVMSGTKVQVRISEYPLNGYSPLILNYCSAYEATLDRTNYKLASVRNFTAQYRGCGNQSDWDGTYRSALGRPASAISLTNFRNYARARKSGSTEWNCMTYEMQKEIYWLFVIEYATLNCQLAFNAQKTSEGYRQGGLGDGVTNAPDWGTFNGYYPFIECGASDSLGNGTGVVSVDVKGSDGTTTWYNASVPRYRGIENPFGHLFQWTDGVLVEIGADSDTGLSRVYTAADPANYADTIGTGYTYVGNEVRTAGYGKTHILGSGGEIIPSAVGGGSTTYLCDYHYTSIPESGKATRGVLFGGFAYNGAIAGFVYSFSSYSPSITDASVGSRLCFIPSE